MQTVYVVLIESSPVNGSMVDSVFKTEKAAKAHVATLYPKALKVKKKYECPENGTISIWERFVKE